MSLFIQYILCQSAFLLSVYLGMRIKCDGYINLIFFSWHVQFIGDLHGRDRLVVEYAITIKVVSSNSIMARSTRYNIMWKSCQVGGFPQVLRFPIKLTTTIFTEILLKVALDTIILILILQVIVWWDDHISVFCTRPTTKSWIFFIALANRNNDSLVDISLNLNTNILTPRYNQPVLPLSL